MNHSAKFVLALTLLGAASCFGADALAQNTPAQSPSTSPSTPARPDTITPWGFRLELGAGAMLRDFDHDDIALRTPMVRATARISYAFVDALSLQVNFSLGRFFRDSDSVGYLDFTAGLRFEPQIGSAGRLWIDGNFGVVLPGTLTRPGFDTGLGFEFRVTPAIGLGPFVRFGYMFDARAAVTQVDTNNIPGTQRPVYTSPDLMYALAGVSFTLHRSEPAPLPPPPPAPTDTDHDGVADPQDQCVNEPAGEHPDPSRAGCPLGDADNDGVFDPQDQCVNEPAGEHPDPARAGCPLSDTDHDGVFDPQDQCVNEPAGAHPDPARAGCPDGDGDHDGVTDHVDQCPTQPAGIHPDPERAGCPAPDRDHDNVPDAVDACPTRAGAPSSNPRRNGCPGLVSLQEGQLRINRPVFFANNSDTVLRTSFAVLNAVVDALNATPEVRHISIEGHTDDVGNDATNLDLSRRRAESVMRYLVDHHIEASRLSAQGFGETRPLVQGTTARARAQNRRVEFRITDIGAPPAATTQATPTATPPATSAAPASH